MAKAMTIFAVISDYLSIFAVSIWQRMQYWLKDNRLRIQQIQLTQRTPINNNNTMNNPSNNSNTTISLKTRTLILLALAAIILRFFARGIGNALLIIIGVAGIVAAFRKKPAAEVPYYEQKPQPLDADPLLHEAALTIVQNQCGSTSWLQEQLKVNFFRATFILEQLEQIGVVGAYHQSDNRKVLVSNEVQVEDLFEQFDFSLLDAPAPIEDKPETCDPLTYDAAILATKEKTVSTQWIKEQLHITDYRAFIIKLVLEGMGIIETFSETEQQRVLIHKISKVNAIFANFDYSTIGFLPPLAPGEEIEPEEEGNEVTLSDYLSANNAADRLLDYITRQANDRKLRKHLNDLADLTLPYVDEKMLCGFSPNSYEGKLHLLLMVDCLRTLTWLGHDINFQTSEGRAVMLLMVRVAWGVRLPYEQMPLLYRPAFSEPLEALAKQLIQMPEIEEIYHIAKVVNGFDHQGRGYEYLLRMTDVIYLIDMIDEDISARGEECIKQVMDLSSPSSRGITPGSPTEESLPSSALEELNQLIGLDNVKQEVTALTNLIKVQQQRRQMGLKVPSPSYHCVFTGNPGTGKTTIARIVADIYRELGILKKGHLVETDRSGLVAEYVGQTAVKTNQIIDSALDGILFIDEAYTLVSASGDDYGAEAIATLLKRMEDNRDRLVVILAGYSQEMKDFINSNPGLQSRFNRYIDFPDYTAAELLQIYCNNMAKYQYELTDAAKAKASALFEHAVQHKNDNFGNARYVRNLFEKTIERQSNRLAPIGRLNKQQLSRIEAEDIPEIDN